MRQVPLGLAALLFLMAAAHAQPVPGVNFDSGAVTVDVTPSGTHNAGSSVGGLFSVPIARANGSSGIITNLAWTSSNGATGQLLVRIWQKSPANTTCTDGSAFVGNFATDDKQLISPPFSITPSAPANTTGDSTTYASLTGLTFDYKNSDTSPSKNLYVCVVTVANDTTDPGFPVRLMLSGPTN